MIDLGLMPDAQAQAWGTLVELHQIVPDHWTIVGGQMVYAHCMDRGFTGARPTMDADTVPVSYTHLTLPTNREV